MLENAAVPLAATTVAVSVALPFTVTDVGEATSDVLVPAVVTVSEEAALLEVVNVVVAV